MLIRWILSMRFISIHFITTVRHSPCSSTCKLIWWHCKSHTSKWSEDNNSTFLLLLEQRHKKTALIQWAFSCLSLSECKSAHFFFQGEKVAGDSLVTIIQLFPFCFAHPCGWDVILCTLNVKMAVIHLLQSLFRVLIFFLNDFPSRCPFITRYCVSSSCF